MDPLFPPLPSDLASLSDEDLAAAIEERVALAERVHEGDADLIGDRSAAEIIDEMTAGVEQIEALRAETQEREVALNEAETTLSALAARIGIGETAEPDGEGDGDGGGDVETEEPAVAEAVVAAAPVRGHQAARRVTLARSRSAAPISRVPESRTSITASSDIPGVATGSELDMLGVAEALMKRRRAIGHTPKGVSEKIPVATIRRRYDADESLVASDLGGNWSKIDAKIGRRALVASGGLCAPVTPYYDLQQIATNERPVRDSLPRFGADRGGISFLQPPSIADVTTGVGVKTAAEDEAGGTTATKTCQQVTCPTPDEVDVDMIYWCLQFGNLGSRAWPEQVAQFLELTMAAHAREAETVILDGIAAASTATTATGSLGAVGSLLGEILTAAVAMRSRHRMPPEAILRVLLPDWTPELLIVDLMRSQFQRFEWTEAGVVSFLRSQRIEPTFYLDSATGAGQVFGAQAAAALLNFPSTVVWYIYPEGSYLWLDGGTLDLGIVRDSVLNTTNDYSIFGETFENVAFVGVESIKVTSTVCASGIVSAPLTVTCPVL